MSFPRRALIALYAVGVVSFVVCAIVAKSIGDPTDPLALANVAFDVGLAGLIAACGCSAAAMLGNHCPNCKAEMKYVVEDGGRLGLHIKVFDVLARDCRQCGHVRD